MKLVPQIKVCGMRDADNISQLIDLAPDWNTAPARRGIGPVWWDWGASPSSKQPSCGMVEDASKQMDCGFRII